MPPQLLFIEGIPGSGKSTLAQTCGQIANTDWVFEIATDHPLKSLSSFTDCPEGYLQESLTRFKNLVKNRKNERRSLVLDGALFQKAPMLALYHQINPSKIGRYLDEVNTLLSEVSFHVVYLTVENLQDHTHRLFDLRGSQFERAIVRWTDQCPFIQQQNLQGRSGYIKFWEEYDRSSKNWLSAFSPHCSLLSSHHTNPSLRNEFQSRFNLDPIPILPGKLTDRVCGRYQKTTCDDEVVLKLEKDVLIAENLVPLLEEKSILLPLDNGRFLVQGQDITLHPTSTGFQIKSSWERVNGEKLVYQKP